MTFTATVWVVVMSTSMKSLHATLVLSTLRITWKVRKEDYGSNASCNVCVSGSENYTVLQLDLFGITC